MEGLAPHWGEFVAVGVIMVLYGVAMFDGYGIVDLINIVGPAAFAVVVALSTLRMTRLNIHAIWAPLFWYRVAMVTYLGIGSTITSFFNADTRDLIQSLFAFFPSDLLKFNLVNAMFHECALITSWIVIQIYRGRSRARGSRILSIEGCRLSLKMVGLAFLGVGLATNYLLVYPAAVGILRIHVANAVTQVGQMAYVGYFLLSYWGLQNRNYRWIAAIIVLAAIDSIVGLLELTKYAAIFPVLMIPIAYVYQRPTARRIALSLAFLVPFYLFVSSVVYDARERVERDLSNGNAVLSDTVDVMGDIAAGRKTGNDGADYQLAWARLSYVNAGTLAISFHDQGLAGDTLRDIFIVWIPRVVFPDKPNITDISREFTYMANGNYDSSTNPSMPSEGYWDYGWLGVALFATLFGAVLTLWSIYSTIVFERGAWHLLLVVLLGMRTGVRVDGMLVPDVIGPLSAVLAIHIACQLANRLLPRLPILQRGLA
ncbi:hypothetical protein [Sphingomonas sp.]|jgi:hypothetical protein|uniref:hypothetical protein n=1 Tax=Sphingomonas sp. TaxID=28214 RepID=UPI002E31CD57|nr:hypothetical protein [Sphingomonas sp.]HEX4695906.1 hypothetical protein [Sphingomonas sp.]